MNQSSAKFGVRFLSRKERTVRRVTKSETKLIQKRLHPVSQSSQSSSQTSTDRVRPKTVRSKPATLIKKKRESRPKKNDEEIIVVEDESTASVSQRSKTLSNSIHGRILQTSDLEKLARLSCSQEFSLFHKEIRDELKSNEQQLAFLETKLNHLRNEFDHQLTKEENLHQIHQFFLVRLQKYRSLNVEPNDFLVLMHKLQDDIRQAIDKWLKKKDFSRVNKPISEFSQKRQSRIQELIKQSIEQARRDQIDDEPMSTETLSS